MRKTVVSALAVVLLLGCSAESPESSKSEKPQSPATANIAARSSIPGTSVSLSPPEGFMPADRFPGFMKESTGSSIMVSEIPAPYAEVTAGFSDKKQMQTRGMTLLSHSSVKVNGQRAMLIHVEQPAYGTLF